MRVVAVIATCLLLAAVCATASSFQPELKLNDFIPRALADAPEVNASVSIRASLFNKVFQDAIPIINNLAAHVTVPGESQKHFKFSAFNLTNFSLGNLTAKFAEPASLDIKGSDLSLAIPPVDFEIMDYITCKGTFFGDIKSTDLRINAALTVLENGTLQIASVTPNVTFGELLINHTIDGTLCKDIEGIIEKFIGSLNKLIEGIIVKELPTKLAPLIMKKANGAFKKLPFAFVTEPVVYDDTLGLTADVLSNVGITRVSHFGDARVGQYFTNRDVTISMDSASVDALFGYEVAAGHFAMNRTVSPMLNTTLLRALFPIIYRRCPACPLSLDLFATTAPVVTMHKGTFSLYLENFRMGINAANVSAGVYDHIVDLGFNMTVQLKNVYINKLDSKLFFDIEIPTFDFDVAVSSIGPIDVNKISDFINTVVRKVLVPVFNMDFPGIKLKLTEHGIGLQKADIMFDDDVLAIGADLKLPF